MGPLELVRSNRKHPRGGGSDIISWYVLYIWICRASFLLCFVFLPFQLCTFVQH